MSMSQVIERYQIPRSTTRQVSQDDQAVFAKNGVVKFDQIIDPQWCSRLGEAINRIVESTTDTERQENGGFYQESNLWKKYDLFREFLVESGIASIAGVLMGTNRPQLFEDSLLVKEPACERETPWHQDQPYYSIVGAEVCTLWIPFDEVTIETGTLQYIKGSYLWGKWFRPVAFTPGKDMGCDQFDVLDPVLEKLHEHEILSFNFQPGDCAVHHGLTLHSAYSNKSITSQRRAYAITFTGEDVRVADFQVKPKQLLEAEIGTPLDQAVFPICEV